MLPEPSAITCSIAHAENLPLVCDILEEAAAWLNAHGISQWTPGSFTLEEVMAWQRTGVLLLAWQGDTPVGTVTVAFTDDALWQNVPGDAGYIYKLAVRRRVAGTGVSRVLLRAAETYIAQAGKSLARLDCWLGNTALHAFYVSAGYTLVGSVAEETWECALFARTLTPHLPASLPE